MTAHELAKILLGGPDVMVTVRGYEYGVDEVKVVDPPNPIHINANLGHSYAGAHDYHYNDGFCDVADKLEAGDWSMSHPAPQTMAIHIK